MNPIRPIEVDLIIAINRQVCHGSGEPFQVRDRGLLESAVHAAFYPGIPPYVNGGLAGVVGALGYSIIKNHCFENGNKRTATLVMAMLFKVAGYNLLYPGNSFADVVEETAKSDASKAKEAKEELALWLDCHKTQN